MKKSSKNVKSVSKWMLVGLTALLCSVPGNLLGQDEKDKKPAPKPAAKSAPAERHTPQARPAASDTPPPTHSTPATDRPARTVTPGAPSGDRPSRNTYPSGDRPSRTTTPDTTPTRTYPSGDSTPGRTYPSGNTPNRTYTPGTPATPSRTYTPGGGGRPTGSIDSRPAPVGGRQFGGGRPTPGSVRPVVVRGDHSVYRAPGGRVSYERQMPDGRRVYADGRGRGHIETTYVYNSRTVVQRTYYMNGRAYPRYYNPYVYRGVTLNVYVPSRYYGPAFYGWAYNPWAVPVVYSWGFSSRPWYGYYGGYFTPYPTYASPSLWLTDYMISQNLEQSYQAQQQQQQMMQQQAYAAPMSADVKNQIAEEVRRQIQLEGQERQAAQSGLPDPQTSSVAGMLQDNTSHVFVVSAPLTVGSANGQCPITEGDALQLTPSQEPNADFLNVLVLASKGQDCPRGSMVSVGVADLQDMQNAMRQTIDQGMAQLQQQQGQGGLPSLPPGAAAPAQESAYARVAPPPDPNGAQQVAQEWSAGDQAAQQAPPADNYAQPQPPGGAEPVQLGLGMSMADVEASQGRPSTILSPGANRKIYVYPNFKVTFTDGRVTDIQ